MRKILSLLLIIMLISLPITQAAAENLTIQEKMSAGSVRQTVRTAEGIGPLW